MDGLGERDATVFSVSDSAEDADRYRTSTAEQHADKGGIGLSTVRAVAESYGGTVTAWRPGQENNSAFEVRLLLTSEH